MIRFPYRGRYKVFIIWIFDWIIPLNLQRDELLDKMVHLQETDGKGQTAEFGCQYDDTVSRTITNKSLNIPYQKDLEFTCNHIYGPCSPTRGCVRLTSIPKKLIATLWNLLTAVVISRRKGWGNQCAHSASKWSCGASRSLECDVVLTWRACWSAVMLVALKNP